MIYSMFTMVILSFLIGVCALVARVNSVRAGQVGAKAFRLMDGDFPEKVRVTTRLFNNQFEVPVLFYVGTLAYLVLGLAESGVGLVLAWLFVVSRFVHAYIHITYNHLLHRIAAFWFGVMAVMGLWINLIVSLSVA